MFSITRRIKILIVPPTLHLKTRKACCDAAVAALHLTHHHGGREQGRAGGGQKHPAESEQIQRQGKEKEQRSEKTMLLFPGSIKRAEQRSLSCSTSKHNEVKLGS